MYCMCLAYTSTGILEKIDLRCVEAVKGFSHAGRISTGEVATRLPWLPALGPLSPFEVTISVDAVTQFSAAHFHAWNVPTQQMLIALWQPQQPENS